MPQINRSSRALQHKTKECHMAEDKKKAEAPTNTSAKTQKPNADQEDRIISGISDEQRQAAEAADAPAGTVAVEGDGHEAAFQLPPEGTTAEGTYDNDPAKDVKFSRDALNSDADPQQQAEERDKRVSPLPAGSDPANPPIGYPIPEDRKPAVLPADQQK
jgi:hypothetical protein